VDANGSLANGARRPGRIRRRTFLKAAAWLGGAAAVGALGVAAYEPYALSLERIEITLPRLPRQFDGFRIAQLSDIHFEEFVSAQHVVNAVAAANNLAPDLILLTGDFVSEPFRSRHRHRAAEKAWPCAQTLRALRAPHGVIAILGNHDHYTDPDLVAAALTQNGIELFRNDARAVETQGARLWIAGLDDALVGRADPERALRQVPQNETVIVAAHEPDFADVMKNYPVDFQVSGHSHGGQVRLPLIGAPILPEMSTKYPMGCYRIERLQLYTNRGLGVIGVPFRFRCPPELTLFTLRRGDHP
jgi:hypothetical protein